MKLTILNWMRYLVGRQMPSTLRFLRKEKLSMAYKIGYGDYVWSRMGGKFRYKGIPLKDRINDYSARASTFFEGIKEDDRGWYAPTKVNGIPGFGSKLKK